MEFKDYYKIMGVARDATQDEIKRTYRKLARKYHPDVSKEADAEARFKELGEAYEVLKDAEKRAAYDQLGANWKGGQEFRPPPDWNAGFEFSGGGFGEGDGSDYSDFFASLFGQGFRAGGPGRAQPHAKGEDHHAKVLIDLEDTYQGATRTITLRVPGVDAQGHVITRERVLNVTIPKGIREGQHIRLSGQGSAGIGRRQSGRSVSPDRIPSTPALPGRWSRSLSRLAGDALGSGAGRNREGADTRRHRGTQNTRRLGVRPQNAAEGTRHTGRPARRLLCDPVHRAAASRYRSSQGPVPENGTGT